MTDEPIFDRLEEAWHHGIQDIEGVRNIWGRLAHRNATATVAEAPTGKATGMNLTEVGAWLAAHSERVAADAKQIMEEVAPVVASAAGNPLAGLPIVHLSAEFLSGVAAAVMDADAKEGAAKQAAADAQAAQEAALAAANPPAEDAPADAAPAEAPAG